MKFVALFLWIMSSYSQASEHYKSLSPQEAKVALLSEKTEPYFSQLQAMEIAALTGVPLSDSPLPQQRNKIKHTFAGFVREFTAEESNALQQFAKKVDKQYQKISPLVAAIPWVFIKVDSQYCGGFLHTRENFIVFPEKFTQLALEATKDENSSAHLRVCRLMLHEKLHIAQRLYPEKFRALYKELWGFEHRLNLKQPEGLNKRLLNNPDALDLGFIIKLEQTWYWPRVLFKPGSDYQPTMGRDFRNYLIPLGLENGNFKVLKKSGQTILQPFSNPSYKSLFSEHAYERGGDHPHEIAAYSLEQVAGYVKVPNSDKAKLETFSKTLQKHIKH